MKISQITNPALGQGLESRTGISFFQDVLPAGITLAFVAGSIIFLFTLITGAISWMTSGGDKQKVETARGRITSAIIGIILMLVAYALIGIIENFFNINLLGLDIGPLKIQ